MAMAIDIDWFIFYNNKMKQDIQNDNSLCFNESHQKYVEPKCEPNDLLVSSFYIILLFSCFKIFYVYITYQAKVECYIRANPTSHITKNRLTVRFL